MTTIKCVFFDRDGIVNCSPGEGYVERWEDFRFQAGFVEVLRQVVNLGYAAIVVTNQSGVARGLMTCEALEDIHEHMRQSLCADVGLEFLDVLYCPHLGETCNCRKPRPGMLLEAASRHGIDLQASWMVGDSERDVVAGKEAGCRTVLVRDDVVPTEADFRVPNLEELQSLIATRFPFA